MKRQTHKQRYLEKLAEQEELGLIDDHAFIEAVYADLPPVFSEVNPVVRIVLNLLGIGITGGLVAYFSSLAPIPQWFAIMCGVAWMIVLGLIWLGSALDRRNA
jgi:hypothetical protein